MNIPNLHSMERELEEAFNALQLSAANISLARAYLLEPDSDDEMLARAEAQDFGILQNNRFHVAGKIMRALNVATEECSARFLKLLWAIGGISACRVWSMDGFGRMSDMDSFPWRCQVLGPARAVYMAVHGMCGRHIGQDGAYQLFALAERQPQALIEAQQLCKDADPNTQLLLGAMLVRVSQNREVVVQQTAVVGTLLIAGLKYVLPGIPRDQLQELVEYIVKGDPAASVPTPAFVPNAAVDAVSAQYANHGMEELLSQFSLAAFLAAGRDAHIRCVLRICLMLNPRLVFITMARCLTEPLFCEALDLLRRDTPGGGAALLLILSNNIYYYKNYVSLIMDLCRGALEEAMVLAGPAQYMQLQELSDAELPETNLREKLITFFSETALKGREEVRNFLEGSGRFSDIRRELAPAIGGGYANPEAGILLLRSYLNTKGWDDFACRCCAVVGIVFEGHYLHMISFKGQGQYDGEILCEMSRQLIRRGLSAFDVMVIFNGDHDDTYNERVKERLKDAVLALAEPEYTADLCRAVGAGTVFLRSTALDALDTLSAEPGAKEAILSAAGDSSKQVREQVGCILRKHPEWVDDYKTLLTAKKAAVRQTAVEILAKMGERSALEAALPNEKNAKVSDAILAVLGVEAGPAVGSPEELAEGILKGGKLKKLGWLLEPELPGVRKSDGSEANDDIRNAILVSYAELGRIGRSDTAAELAKELERSDLEKLACEVYERWYAGGAQAKHKWVLAFAAVFGGAAMTARLQKAINDWPNHQRGAIACEAVMALALSPDPAAIVIVDAISRKFKFRQVKTAAAAALENAAKELGITAEELADRIVPDLGFGKDGKRIFDYGKRSFTVRLTPTLELTIINDQGKAVKNLPAPGKTDDPQAETAYEDFKTMKKQIKTTVTAQRARLEAALSVLRCWDTERWQALFVHNPIMHQFAMSLVWGVYEDGRLTDTFRYMEDGTFNTVDEDEYTLPAGAKIGLVHPVELDADTLDGWKQQLEDYEIKQSIDQLERPVYRLEESRAGEKALEDFGGKKLNALSLSGKLLGLGWYRGSVMDGGWVTEFYREDSTLGIGVELRYSGAAVGYDDGEPVTVYDAVFYTGTVRRGSYIDERVPEEHILTLGQVPARYFSEIMLHLTRATASSTEVDENWRNNRS